MDVGGGGVVEDSVADLRRLLPFTEGGNRPGAVTEAGQENDREAQISNGRHPRGAD